MNKVILFGRLTKDPELRSTASGIPVCNFTVACDRRFVKQGEEHRVPAASPEGKRRCGTEEEPAQSEALPGLTGRRANKPRSDVDFINCIAWQKSAESIAQYFKKGHRIALEGSIQTRSWTDNEGKARYSTEVVVEQWEFAQSKSEGGAVGQAVPGAAHFPDSKPTEPLGGDLDGFMPVDEDSLPF